MAVLAAKKPATSLASAKGAESGAPKRLTKARPRSAKPLLQAKLTINEPNDRFEQEADSIADRVMHMPEKQTRVPGAASGSAPGDRSRLQRQEEEEEEALQTSPLQRQEEEEEAQTFSLQRQEEEEQLQTSALQRRQGEEEEEAQTASLQRQEEEAQAKSHRRGAPCVTRSFETSLSALRAGGGRPLDAPLRQFMESRFGRGLGDVRVHTGPGPAALAKQANARAFTVGRHLVFGSGEYRPNADQGRHLIAHELTHVLQQRGGLHSVQREVFQPEGGEPTPRADLALLDELRELFQLRTPSAPPSIVSIAVDLLRQGLAGDDATVGVFTLDSLPAAATSRTIESAAYRLELAAQQSTQGIETRWTLTRRDSDQSISSPSQLVPRQGDRPLALLDDATVSLPAASPRTFSPDTIAAELASRPSAGEVDTATQTRQTPAGGSTSATDPPNTVAETRQASPTPAAPARPGATSAEQQPAEDEPALPERAPTSPAEDPQFQATLRQTKRARNAQSDHAPASQKGEQTTQGGYLPVDEQQSKNDRLGHLDQINAADDEHENSRKTDEEARFTPETFKKLFQSHVDRIKRELPKNESGAKRFKRDKPLEKMKEDVRQEVETQNKKVGAGISNQVKVDQPPPSNVTPDTPADIKADPTGEPPASIRRATAAPKPRADWEISMAKESASLDKKMADEDLTEDQLAQSNEPDFVKTLETKKEAQSQAAQAPERYREQEGQTLAAAQGKAAKAGKKGLGGMFDTRQESFSGVFAAQTVTATTDQLAQRVIHQKFEGIYSQTKIDVNKILDDLATDVNDIFTADADAAKRTFESKVESKLDDIYGFTVVDDWLFGEDTEAIEKAFREEKERFLSTMNDTLDRIARIIARQLNAALTRIRKGKTDQQNCFDSLDENQQKLAKGALEMFTARYDMLEESVDEKQKELAESLASTYVSNVKSLRESFDTIKEEVSRGWIGGAIDAIAAVATTVKKLGELLWSILSRIGDVISDILRHPIRFLENLGKGISAGFKAFISQIDEHLLGAFFDWIRGTVAGPAIQMPAKFDPAGIFSLVSQVLSLSFETFKKIAGRVWGKKAVALIEKGEAVGEKGLEIFQLVKMGGVGALWAHIKELLSTQLNEVFDKIKTTVLYETIKKVLAFIATLFTPIGAFIKAVQAIYAGVRFLVDNIDRIVEIVNAFLSSVELAVKGQVGAISAIVVKALKTFLVVAIDFLAKLLRLGKLDDKVRRILKTLRRPIERGMEWLLKKLKPIVRKLMAKFQKKNGGSKKVREENRAKLKDGEIGEVIPFPSAERPHTLGIDPSTGVAMVASKNPGPVANVITAAEKDDRFKAAAKKAKALNTRINKKSKKIIKLLKDKAKLPEAEREDSDVEKELKKLSTQLIILMSTEGVSSDDTATPERFGQARALKAFNGPGGFTAATWKSRFKLEQGQTDKDLQFGRRNKIIELQSGKNVFTSEVSNADVVRLGTQHVLSKGRSSPRFKKKFSLADLTAWLQSSTIQGLPQDPGIFTPGRVQDILNRLIASGGLFVEISGARAKYTLAGVPPVRELPASWSGKNIR